MPIFNVIHPDDRERARERTRHLKETLEPLPMAEMRLLGLDGKTRIGELQAVPFMQDGVLHVISSGRDVTAQRDAESRLHQVQKMDAVGQLTGGVAHDFNNLLTVIIGALDFDAQRVPPELRPAIDQALRAAERGGALTHRLLAFSRQQTLMARRVDFNRLIGEMDELLRRTLGEHVEIELKLAADLWPALADSGQVENSLLNLAINARDAMAEGGKLTIETGNVHLDDDYAASNAEVAAGDYVMMAVTDTGTGMPPDVLARVFEPFYTTKEVGKGTGLGLSMVYGFAQQSGGSMQIRSEPGHGTAVKLFFPRIGTPQASAALSAGQQAKPTGSETILVVEDDDMVRGYVEGELKALGYRVVVTRDAPAALAILRGPEKIHLLFTDVVMPGGMFGTELAKEAARLRPHLKILLTSGYTEHPVDAIDGGGREVRILSKPYRRHDLAATLRSVLKAS